MKLVCRPYCPNEYAMDADLLLLEITPEEASRILAAMERSREFLLSMCEDGLAGHICDGVSLPSPLDFTLFGAKSVFLEAVAELIEEDCWVLLPDGFDPESECLRGGSDNLTPCECFRMMVYETSISITALSKYGDDRFECCSLVTDLLRNIAEQQQLEGVKYVDTDAINNEVKSLDQ